jgi:hypothetical protein
MPGHRKRIRGAGAGRSRNVGTRRNDMGPAATTTRRPLIEGKNLNG